MKLDKQVASLGAWAVVLAGGITLLAASYRPAWEMPDLMGGTSFRGAELELPVLFVGALVTIVAAIQVFRLARRG